MREIVRMVLVAVLLAPAVSEAQSDSAQVVASLGRFVTALYDRDTTAVRLFDADARLTLVRPTQGGELRVLALAPEQFIRAISNPSGPRTDEPLRNLQMTIDGPLATVWTEYQVRREGGVSHCGHDAFHLIRRADGWKILHVSDTFRQQGCGAVWTDAPIDPVSRPVR